MGSSSPRCAADLGMTAAPGDLTRGKDLELLVHGVLNEVDDPEYPGISIVELGLLEQVIIEPNGVVSIGLIPTFSGCPALAIIANEVERVVKGISGVDDATVTWLASPVWTVDRISPETQQRLASNFTVAVQIGRESPQCPRCGEPTVEQSMFGPSRCRAINRCPACSETVEVMRS